MSNLPIDIHLKNKSKNTAWNYDCMLLQPKIDLMIKKTNELTVTDKQFLNQLLPSAPNWNLLENKTINKNANDNRIEIFFQYYTDQSKITAIHITSKKS